MSKVSTITLVYPVLSNDPLLPIDAPENVKFVYRIVKVTDSIEFSPGEQLSRSQVEQLCESKHWKVIISN